MKKLVVGCIFAMMFSEQLSAAEVGYHLIDPDELFIEKPSTDHYSRENPFKSLDSFDRPFKLPDNSINNENSGDLGRSYQTSQGTFSDITIVNPLKMDDVSPKEIKTIRKFIQSTRKFFRSFLKKDNFLRTEESDSVFKERNRKLLERSIEESNKIYLSIKEDGFQYLDASLKKRLTVLQSKLQSSIRALSNLLNSGEPFTMSQRKKVFRLTNDIEQLKSQINDAVNNFRNSLEGEAGKKKLAKFAQDSKVIEEVIKNGNVSVMKLLLANGATITKERVEMALADRQYGMFRLFEEKGLLNSKIVLNPKIITDLFKTSVEEGDVDGVIIAYGLMPLELRSAKTSSLLEEIKTIIDSAKKWIKEIEQRDRRSLSLSREQVMIYKELDKQQLEATKKTLENLKEIQYFLLDKEVRSDASDVVGEAGNGFDFTSVDDVTSRKALENVYKEILDSSLQVFDDKITLKQKIKINQALALVDPETAGKNYAKLVESGAEPINGSDTPLFLKDMQPRQLDIFTDAYKKELEKELTTASDRTKETIISALNLISSLR